MVNVIAADKFATQMYDNTARAAKSGSSDAWFDGNLAVLSKSGGNYTTFAPDGEGNTIKGVGPITDIAASATTISMASGQPAGTSYIGGGNVVDVSGDGQTLAMVVHLERPVNSGTYFYASLGICKSTNAGSSWTCLGEMLTLNYAYNNVAGSSQDIDGGSLALDPSGAYYYLYFREWDGPTNDDNWMSVSRCTVSSFNTAVTNGTVPTFDKWQGGTSWGGTLGYALNIDFRWMDVWRDDAHGYVACGALPAMSFPHSINVNTSQDGLTWDDSVEIESDGGNGEYSGLVPTEVTGNRRGTGPWYCVYLTGSRWSDVPVKYRQIQIRPTAVGTAHRAVWRVGR